MFKFLIISLIIISSISTFGQTARNFAWYDKYTYELYQNKEWEKLIANGKKAINAGYDYFYLRMRLGIAYYELNKYHLAIKQFEKALNFNSGDALAAEYLYYSYKFSGRRMDANLAYAQYRGLLESQNISSSFGIFTGLYSEGGFKFISPGTDSYGPLNYIHFGIQQQLGSRLNLYHGYMRYSQNTYSFETVNQPGFRPPTTVKTKTKYGQNEYYFKATFAIFKGLQLIGSLHTQSVKDSLRFNNFAYSLGISSSVNMLDLYAGYGAATISDTLNRQITARFTFYPVNNQDFYLQSAIIYHFKGNSIFYQKIGLRTGEKVWFEIFGSFGDMKGVQEFEGFYIYNVNDHLNRRIGINGIFLLSNKVKLSVGYTSESYEQLNTLTKYKNHYIYTGLQFRFKS